MNLGQYSFSCPQCRAELNNSKVITLNTERANRDKGVIQLSVGVGDYTFKHEPKTEFNEGEIVSFYCPHCKADLSAPQHKDFILLKLSSFRRNVLLNLRNLIKNTLSKQGHTHLKKENCVFIINH